MGCASSIKTYVAPPEGAVAVPADFDAGYETLEEIGRGSFGFIFAAKCRATGWRGAVKVLDTTRRAQGAKSRTVGDFTQRVRMSMANREVTLWTALSGHPNIVELRQSFSDGEMGCWCMVMERCECTVAEHLQRVPHELEDMPWLLRQTLRGVLACHQATIVHRDIKAENFLMAAGGSAVKLCDFGVSARFRDRGLLGLYGTAPLMSPEMLAGVYYGTGTDVWSFGSTWYLLMFGEFPYVPEHSDKKSAKAAIRAGIPTPRWLSSTSQGDPVAVDFLRSMLQRDPNARTTCSTALKHALLRDDRDCRSDCSATGKRNSLANTTAAQASCGAGEHSDSGETLTPTTDNRPLDFSAESP